MLVLAEARALVALADNDFSRSSWSSAEEALRELDGVVRRVEASELQSALGVLFAPTGPLQELAIASGWGEKFLALADRFDRASTGKS
jgi:hypothetical protein